MTHKIAMDPQQQAIQSARALSFLALQTSAITQFLLIDENKKSRLQNNFQERGNWDEFVEMHINRGSFRRRLRMSYDSFCVLLEVIRYINVNEEMGSLRGAAICQELHLSTSRMSKAIFHSSISYINIPGKTSRCRNHQNHSDDKAFAKTCFANTIMLADNA